MLRSFLADAPGFCDALGVIGDGRVALHLAENGDHHLVRSFALELRELLVQPQRRFLGDDARVIIEIAGWLRRNGFSGADDRAGEDPDSDKKRGDSHSVIPSEVEKPRRKK